MKLKERQKQLEIDLVNLSDTELRKKYSGEYSSFHNMNQREKEGIAMISLEFKKFRNFLRIVGIRVNKTYTLDRINNKDSEYAESKIRWANKKVQNNNRSNNIFLTHDDGRKCTIAQWAEITEQKSDTLYKRRNNNWNDMEIITGERIHYDLSIETNPFPYKTRSKWEARYSNFAVSGGGLSKLHFLWYVLKNIKPEKDEVLIIRSILNRRNGLKKKCDCEDDCNGFCNYDFLDSIIDENNHKLIIIAQRLSGYSTEALSVKLEKISRYIEKHNHIFPQINEMYEYQLLRKKAIDNKHKDIDKATLLKHFENINPKPFYNINLPETLV